MIRLGSIFFGCLGGVGVAGKQDPHTPQRLVLFMLKELNAVECEGLACETRCRPGFKGAAWGPSQCRISGARNWSQPFHQAKHVTGNALVLSS
jgi:hypothetical protein